MCVRERERERERKRECVPLPRERVNSMVNLYTHSEQREIREGWKRGKIYYTWHTVYVLYSVVSTLCIYT